MPYLGNYFANWDKMKNGIPSQFIYTNSPRETEKRVDKHFITSTILVTHLTKFHID